jgi:hypothetical protein
MLRGEILPSHRDILLKNIDTVLTGEVVLSLNFAIPTQRREYLGGGNVSTAADFQIESICS